MNCHDCNRSIPPGQRTLYRAPGYRYDFLNSRDAAGDIAEGFAVLCPECHDKRQEAQEPAPEVVVWQGLLMALFKSLAAITAAFFLLFWLVEGIARILSAK